MTDAQVARSRLTIVGIVCMSLFATLFARLWYLQAIRTDEVVKSTRALHIRTLHSEGPRGRILDRNGKVIVDNEIVRVIGIDKQQARKRGLGDGDPRTEDTDEEVATRNAEFKELAGVLTEFGFPTKFTTIEELFNDVRYGPNDFVAVIGRGVPEDLEIYLGERRDEYPGVEVRVRTVRTYPYGELAAHILGYVGRITDTELKAKVEEQGEPGAPRSAAAKPYGIEDEIGKSGIERSFEEYLRAVPGDERIQVNAKGQKIATLRRAELQPGDDVWLTIDLDLQRFAEQQLANWVRSRRGAIKGCDPRPCDAQEGSVVVIDPRNGDVLAMASYPTFDPSLLVNGISTDLWNQMTTGLKPMLNRATSEAYAPGSTFKLVTSLAALKTGFITPQTTIQDNGTYRIENCRDMRCTRSNAGKAKYGTVDLQKALTVSSDVFYYRIGDQLWVNNGTFGPSPIQDMANEFGFGQQSGIELPTESPGLIGTPKFLAAAYDKNPKAWDHREWTTGDNLNVSIGQGLVAVTPLQLSNAYATFANGGTRYVPNIATRVTRRIDLLNPSDGPENTQVVKTFLPKVAAKVDLSNLEHYLTMFRGLLGVTQRGNGTAEEAFNASPTEWPMAGKTGTAEVTKKSPATGTFEKVADTSIFVGWGPAELGTPATYAVSAIIPQAGFGADAAAPLAFSILRPASKGTLPPVGKPTVVLADAAAAPGEELDGTVAEPGQATTTLPDPNAPLDGTVGAPEGVTGPTGPPAPVNATGPTGGDQAVLPPQPSKVRR